MQTSYNNGGYTNKAITTTTLLRNGVNGGANTLNSNGANGKISGYQSLKDNNLPLIGLNNNNRCNGAAANGIIANGGDNSLMNVVTSGDIIIRAKTSDTMTKKKEFKEWYV